MKMWVIFVIPLVLLTACIHFLGEEDGIPFDLPEPSVHCIASVEYDKLFIIDALNPLDMKIVKKIKCEDRFCHLEMNGTYLYAFHENHDLAIFDISEPSSPVPVKTVENFTLGDYVNTAKIVGDYVYMKLGSEQMWIVDVSDPLNPSVVSTLTFKTDIFNIAESDSRLYMASGKEGLVVMDITDFTSPTLVKDLPWLIFNDIAPLE